MMKNEFSKWNKFDLDEITPNDANIAIVDVDINDLKIKDAVIIKGKLFDNNPFRQCRFYKQVDNQVLLPNRFHILFENNCFYWCTKSGTGKPKFKVQEFFSLEEMGNE